MALKKAILEKLHNLEWFGREGLSPKESIAKYGIAAKCLKYPEMKFDCYAPDPDDDIYCIRFKVCTDELIQAVRSQKDLAEFLHDNGFMFDEFEDMEIVDMLYYACQRYDIMAILSIIDPPTYFRDDIAF